MADSNDLFDLIKFEYKYDLKAFKKRVKEIDIERIRTCYTFLNKKFGKISTNFEKIYSHLIKNNGYFKYLNRLLNETISEKMRIKPIPNP
jgi:hypothetical protein